MHSQKVIIFIGPDGTGKTQIAKALSDKLKIPYFKNKLEWAEPDLTNDTYFVNVLRYGGPFITTFIEQLKCSVIFDRFYPCEYAYSTVFNRRTDLDTILKMDAAFAKMNAVIILCYRPTYSDYLDDHHMEFTSESNLLDIEIAYRDFLQEFSIVPYMELNVSDENLDRELTDIMTFLEKHYGI